MSTWHQDKASREGRAAPLFHATEWTVVIDPPHQMRALMRFSSKNLADVYMRNLKHNNPGAAAHAYILRPSRAA